MDSTQQEGNFEENERIIELQDLIEKNIQIEQKIETCSFGESISAIQDILSKANDIVQGYEERRTNSTELVLDTELLRRNHEVVGKAIQYNTNFTDRMFCTAIIMLKIGMHCAVSHVSMELHSLQAPQCYHLLMSNQKNTFPNNERHANPRRMLKKNVQNKATNLSARAKVQRQSITL
ncbi:uncharacterized protein LOC117780562 isoform X2 [Drosophila innubila]|uniref:uncharacterized protein LOC117780562 isoform X2 n=1 Tax=Drosophila innubila TaxID=198719 RepID=UPI00148D73A5|nr:uncharacterized protein LOC117780562 isoform X2 [Drosophila innubila]